MIFILKFIKQIKLVTSIYFLDFPVISDGQGKKKVHQLL